MFSTTYGIVVMALLSAIVLLLLCLIPAPYVTLVKCGVIKVDNTVVPTSEDRAAQCVKADGENKSTQTKLKGKDTEQLQKRKPSLEDYKGRAPPTTKTHNSISTSSLDEKCRNPENALPRWRDIGPDWNDPWTRRPEYTAHGYIHTDQDTVES